MYIRFSYVPDFFALQALHNLHLMSVRELILKIYLQISKAITPRTQLMIKSLSRMRNQKICRDSPI